jgi:fatty acid-binding protein DegV
MAPLERAVLAHIQRPDAAQALAQSLTDLLPPHTPTLEAGIAIGIHVGPGAAGIALIRPKP